MTKDTQHIAVLTGDLVHSTALGPNGIEAAFAALGSIGHVLSDWHGAPVHMSRHRGDGWQAVLARPEMALRSALAIRAALRKLGPDIDSYIAIATGSIDTPINADLNRETAPVFVSSGDTLDRLKSQDGPRLVHADGAALAAATTLADHISQGWTPAQAAAILPFLTPNDAPSFTEVAAMLNKSRQAVTKSAEAAAIAPLLAALSAIETAP